MAEREGGLGGLFEAIREGAIDLATLEVATYTGSIKLGAAAEGAVDLDNVFKKIEELAKLEGKLELVAATRVSLDRDTTSFVKAGITENEMRLLEAHEGMVRAATEARTAFARMAVELVGIGVK